jgi:hypothetical protein
MLSDLTHLLEDKTRELSRTVIFTANVNVSVSVRGAQNLVGDPREIRLNLIAPDLATNEALRCEDRVLRIGDRLTLRDLPYEELSLLGKGDC